MVLRQLSGYPIGVEYGRLSRVNELKLRETGPMRSPCLPQFANSFGVGHFSHQTRTALFQDDLLLRTLRNWNKPPYIHKHTGRGTEITKTFAVECVADGARGNEDNL
jgi:hypothetical protein